MKKKILLFTALIVSIVSIAQEQAAFGIRAGFTSSGMRGDAVNNLQNLLDLTDGIVTTKNRAGFFAGGYASVRLGENLSVEPAVYYSQKGYELNGALKGKGVDFLGVNAGAALNMHYIDVPVVLKANIGGFQVFGGPQVSYLAQADLRTTAGLLGINLLNSKLDATNQFNRWDVGLTGGVGYQFNNGVNVMAAYDHGLSKVDADQRFNSYNRAFKVGVGITF
ncbi:MAG TPA: porin family protein [Chitinophagaceae bacterium]|nr:porin family protein [Chitinophagaceae bacterium]